MTQVTLDQLKTRLAKEKHLVWVFYRCKNRTDKVDKLEKCFEHRRHTAWTGYWKRPAIEYDRIAHWNDQSQILYVGKRSKQDPVGSGGRWKIPMDEVEKFDVFPKSSKAVKLKVVIPAAAGRIQNVTYWPESQKTYLARGARTLTRSNKPTARNDPPRVPIKKISKAEFEKLQKELDQLAIDADARNEIKREIWCRTSAHARFRTQLLARWENKCSLSGITNQALLIASHIRPWAKCENGRHQISVDNGLLLITPIDKLFDRGFLSFNDDGTICLHADKKHPRHLTDKVLNAFGLSANSPKMLTKKLNSEQKMFMRYHRKEVFECNI
jgi:hypothetical protein